MPAESNHVFSSSSFLRILLVEDNPADVDLIREMLQEMGGVVFQIEAVPRLSEALAHLAIGGVDLMLVDLGLPDSQGLDTFHRLREAAPRVPLVILTGNTDEEVSLTAVREGAQDCLVKGLTGGLLLLRSVRYAVERKQVEVALKESEEKYRLLTEFTADVIWILNLTRGKFTYISPSILRLRGLTPEEAMNEGLEDSLTTESLVAVKDAIAKNALGFMEHPEIANHYINEIQQYCKDGRIIWVEVSTQVRYNPTGDIEVVGVSRDIEKRKKAEEKLRESEQRYRLLIETAQEGILVSQGVYLKFVNPMILELTGRTEDELLSIPFFEFIHPDDRELVRNNQQKRMKGESVPIYHFRLITKDKSIKWVEMSGVKMEWEGQPSSINFVTDITARKHYENQIQQMLHHSEIERNYALIGAMTDGLTGLANRRRFDDSLRTEFYRLKRSGAPLSLIMLDVDLFKNFNDSYGHLAGDDCLRQVAAALKTVVRRAADVVARYGGEEFAVILPETDHHGAATIAERIRKAVAELAIPHLASEAAAYVTVSLGVVSVSTVGLAAPEHVVALADEALYRAKHGGRNRTEVTTYKTAPDGHLTKGSPGFVHLVWRATDECGHATIDEQHKKLFEISNELLSAVIGSRPKDECTALIKNLLSEIVNHFRDEEAVLRAVGYPLVEDHVRCHAELVASATALADKYQRDELSIGELFSFITYDVVAQHMFIEDSKFFPYIVKNQATAVDQKA